MATQGSPRWTGIAILVLFLGAGLAPPPAAAVADPQGDATDNQPDHDLVDVVLTETGDDLQFTITLAGVHRPPVAGVDELEVVFRVAKAEVYQPNLHPQIGSPLHLVGATGENVYGVFRHAGFGYALPEQPPTGVSTFTWKVPKAYLDATAAHRPRIGDWITDIEVNALELGLVVDTATLPDYQLTLDSDPGRRFHLRSDGGSPNNGELSSGAPTGNTPTTATLFHQDTLRAEWRTAPLTGPPLKLLDLSAVLWLTATTSTPVLADEVFLVELYGEAPNGTRTLVAQRTEAVSPTPGATTNLFLAPGAPQRMPFQLVAVNGAERIHAGHRAVLVVSVDGLFSGESGPVVVYHDATDYDSFLLVGKKAVPRPDHAACPAGNQVANLPKAQC